jgi:Nitroreductase
MDAIECLMTRRSVRSFSEKIPDEDTIKTILAAGMYAPSGMNRQTWHFTVITNKEWLTKMSDNIGKTLNRDYHLGYGAPVLIIVSDDKESVHSEKNGACALENMFLAAHACGLGSCWINQLNDPNVLNNKECKLMLSEAGISDSDKIIGSCAVGFTEGDYPLPKPRQDNIIKYYK